MTGQIVTQWLGYVNCKRTGSGGIRSLKLNLLFGCILRGFYQALILNIQRQKPLRTLSRDT